MSTGIGIYPGGPHLASSGKEMQRPPRLMRVNEIEEQLARRSEQIRQRSRRNRLVLAVLLSVSAAGGLGLILGHSTHTTAEELTEALQVKRNPGSGISEEINRVLMELWRMEEVEFANTRRSR